MAKILEILASGFEEIEAVAPADIWRRLGFDVTLAGLDDMQITGAHGITLECDALLDEVAALDFDAVFLPGGMPGSTNLRDSVVVQEIVKSMASAGKVVSAICAAPMVLSDTIMSRMAMYLKPEPKTLSQNSATDASVP